jgi:phage repressor protein C with HTH and peptisase S24 domain
MIYLRRVQGSSMLPNFKPGKLVVFVRRRFYKPGDLVLVRHGGLEKIKRIQKINGSRVFITGDKKKASTDSRHFGQLPLSSIKAAKRSWLR